MIRLTSEEIAKLNRTYDLAPEMYEMLRTIHEFLHIHGKVKSAGEIKALLDKIDGVEK